MTENTIKIVDELSDTQGTLTKIRAILKDEYNQKHNHPWIIAYSGGKDSTLVLQLVFETILAQLPTKRKRQIYIVANDTLVESPLVIEHLYKSIEAVRKAVTAKKLPVITTITKPAIDQTFWVNVIGRGYIPPTRNFRWCTDRMKINPTTRFIEKTTTEYKKTTLLIGTRKSESTSRRLRMEKYEKPGLRMSPHHQIKNCSVFSPIAELTDNEVWSILLQSKPPWGGTHRNLITLYRNAGGGECPLVLSKEDAPSCGSSSPRFGCWTCTVVTKDRSLAGLIDSGFEELEPLLDFRDWLIQLRENNENRMAVRRNGTTIYKKDNTRGKGPFKMDIRQKILNELKKIEQETSKKYITNTEIKIIKDIWRRDKVQHESRNALMSAVETNT